MRVMPRCNKIVSISEDLNIFKASVVDFKNLNFLIEWSALKPLLLQTVCRLAFLLFTKFGTIKV